MIQELIDELKKIQSLLNGSKPFQIVARLDEAQSINILLALLINLLDTSLKSSTTKHITASTLREFIATVDTNIKKNKAWIEKFKENKIKESSLESLVESLQTNINELLKRRENPKLAEPWLGIEVDQTQDQAHVERLNKLSQCLPLLFSINTVCPISQLSLAEIREKGNIPIFLSNGCFYQLYDRTNPRCDLVRWIQFANSSLNDLTEAQLNNIYAKFEKQVPKDIREDLGISEKDDLKRFIDPATRQPFLLENIIAITLTIYELKKTNPELTLAKDLNTTEPDETPSNTEVVNNELNIAPEESEAERQARIEELLAGQERILEELGSPLAESMREMRPLRLALDSSQIDDEKKKIIIQLYQNHCLSEGIIDELINNEQNKRDQYVERLVFLEKWLYELKRREAEREETEERGNEPEGSQETSLEELRSALDKDEDAWQDFLIEHAKEFIKTEEQFANFLKQLPTNKWPDFCKALGDEFLKTIIKDGRDLGYVLWRLPEENRLTFCTEILGIAFLKTIIKDGGDLADVLWEVPEANRLDFCIKTLGVEFLKDIITSGNDLGAVLCRLPEENRLAFCADTLGIKFLEGIIKNGHDLGAVLWRFPNENWLVFCTDTLGIKFLEGIITSGNDLGAVLWRLPEENRLTFCTNTLGIKFLEGIIKNVKDLDNVLWRFPNENKLTFCTDTLGVLFLKEIIKKGKDLKRVLLGLPEGTQLTFCTNTLGDAFLHTIIQNAKQLDYVLMCFPCDRKDLPKILNDLCETFHKSNSVGDNPSRKQVETLCYEREQMHRNVTSENEEPQTSPRCLSAV